MYFGLPITNPDRARWRISIRDTKIEIQHLKPLGHVADKRFSMNTALMKQKSYIPYSDVSLPVSTDRESRRWKG